MVIGALEPCAVVANGGGPVLGSVAKSGHFYASFLAALDVIDLFLLGLLNYNKYKVR